MPRVSEQFYDSDEGEGEDEDETGSSPSEDDEDEEIADEIGVCKFPPHSRRIPRYSHFPQRLQIANAQLSAEVRTLKATGTSKNAKDGGDTFLAIPIVEADRKVLQRGYSNHGKCFAALSELWVRASALRKPYPQRLRDLGPWHPDRCTDNATWEEGIVAELYFFLPDSCHQLIKHSAVFSKLVRGQVVKKLAPDLTASQFLRGAKDFRAYLIDNVRKNAVDIFSIASVTTPHSFSKSYDRSQIPVIVDLLKSPINPDDQYAVYPRALFADYKVVETELFGSSALVKVSRFHPVDRGRRLTPLNRS